MSDSQELRAIGIDLGSLHARVALGVVVNPAPSEGGLVDNQPLPNIISNAQGSRFTLALVVEDKSEGGDDNGVNTAASQDTRYVFGEAARRALARDKKPTISKDPSSLVRHLLNDSTSPEGRGNALAAAAAFFQHLAELGCDASSSHPSKLRTVVSVPVASTPEQQMAVVHSVERGIENAMARRKSSPGDAKPKKSQQKQKHAGDHDDERTVVGVITDPAAVCIAHGLTEVAPSRVVDFAAPQTDSPKTWKNTLVIDWGASGLTATHVRRTSPTSPILSIVRHATETACSGTAIVSSLVSHCASMFERKNRVSGVLDSVKSRHRLEVACESALRTLSRAPTVTVAVDGFYEGIDMAVSISRPRFDMLVTGALRKAEALLLSFACTTEGNEADNKTNFDIVLAAGNVCDMPSAITLIRTKLFPNSNPGRADVPPNEAVAIGCARHAASVLSCSSHSKSGGIKIDDKIAPATRKVPICPLSIGICKIKNGLDAGDLEQIIQQTAVPLIEAGHPLPANVTRMVTCNNKDDSWLSNSLIAIVQIQGGPALNSKILAKIDKLPPTAKSFEITMELTSTGSLTLSVNGGPTCTL